MLKDAVQYLTKKAREIWNDESAQGATEYILLLVVVVSIAMMFRGKIRELVSSRLGALEGGMNQFNPEP